MDIKDHNSITLDAYIKNKYPVWVRHIEGIGHCLIFEFGHFIVYVGNSTNVTMFKDLHDE